MYCFGLLIAGVLVVRALFVMNRETKATDQELCSTMLLETDDLQKRRNERLFFDALVSCV